MLEKRKVVIIVLLVLMFLAIAGVVFYYWYNNTYFVRTEDAKVNGDLVKISAQSSGKVIDFFVDEGDKVDIDEVIGRLDVMNLSDQNIELSLLRSPIKGAIIKKSVMVGEIVSAGQTLGYAADPSKYYITANIEETKLRNVKIGQYVNIKLDLNKRLFLTGHVKTIGEAANAVFSLFPTTSGATFTKTEQKIPVKIKIDNCPQDLVLGTNATVKIHIK